MDADTTTHSPDPLSGLRLGFLGFGQMGQAIAHGLRRTHGPDRLTLLAYDPVTPADTLRESIADLRLADSPQSLESDADVVILAVKPQIMPTALADLEGGKQYISIAAGLSTAQLAACFPTGKPQISRVMPNISATRGHGVSGIFCPDDIFFSISRAIFSAIGQTVRLQREDLMHAVTGLSGSGPAYVLAMIHALAEGGVAAGLPFDMALVLARETVLGTAALLRDSDLHPAVLRNQVTSPGGTTIAGLGALEAGGFHGLLMEAVQAAAERSRELAADSESDDQKRTRSSSWRRR